MSIFNSTDMLETKHQIAVGNIPAHCSAEEVMRHIQLYTDNAVDLGINASGRQMGLSPCTPNAVILDILPSRRMVNVRKAIEGHRIGKFNLHTAGVTTLSPIERKVADVKKVLQKKISSTEDKLEEFIGGVQSMLDLNGSVGLVLQAPAVEVDAGKDFIKYLKEHRSHVDDDQMKDMQIMFKNLLSIQARRSLRKRNANGTSVMLRDK